MESKKCVLCGRQAARKIDENDIYTYYCHNCGCYSISQDLSEDIAGEHIKLCLLSGYVREKYEGTKIPVCLTTNNYREILESPLIPRSVPDKLNKLILYLYNKTECFGQQIKLGVSAPNCPQGRESDNPAVCYAEDTAELIALRRAAFEEDYISGIQSEADGLMLTLKGHKRAEALAINSTSSKKAFVAMWFSDQVQEAYDKAIEPAVRECGFQACRVDKIEHNNDITDEIIAGIKESRFVIADMTGYRGGVYYEAGYAKGLGKEVIITCRKDWFEGEEPTAGNSGKQKIHFDINHFNIIQWSTPEELKKKLITRISATVL